MTLLDLTLTGKPPPRRVGQILLTGDVAHQQRKLSELVRQAADLPSDIQIAVLALAADAIGWQKIRVLRALEGKESP